MNKNVFQESKTQATVPDAGTAQDDKAPAFLKKKGLLGGKGAGMGGIVSPTDNFMSPISAKLNGAKQRHFQKGKPMHLASKLSSLASADSPASSPIPAEKQKKMAEF